MAPHIPLDVLLMILIQLSVLQPEIGYQAASLAIDRLNQKTLASLCLVCRDFRAFAQPLLYQAYLKPRNQMLERKVCRLGGVVASSPSANLPSSYVKAPAPRLNKNLRQFLETLTERPDLAAQVKFVLLEDWDPPVQKIASFEQNDARLTTISKATLLDKHPHTSIFKPDTASCYGDMRQLCAIGQDLLREGVEAADIALLLTLLPNLEELQLQTVRSLTPTDMTKAPAPFLGRVLEQGSWLQKLQRLKLSAPSSLETTVLPLERLAGLLRSPSLRTFTCSFTGDAELQSGFASSLQSISLYNCILDPENIRNLVTSTPLLRSFTLDFDQNKYTAANQTHQLPWSKIRGVLVTQASETLQQLTLTSSRTPYGLHQSIPGQNTPWRQTALDRFSPFARDHDTQVGSLQSLVKLEMLCIEQQALINDQDLEGRAEAVNHDDDGNDDDEDTNLDSSSTAGFPDKLTSLVLVNCTPAASVLIRGLLRALQQSSWVVSSAGSIPATRSLYPRLNRVEVRWLVHESSLAVKGDGGFVALRSGFRALGVEYIEQ